MEDLLEKYEPGHPNMKPDVIKQTKEIEEKRAKMIQEQQPSNGMTSIMLSKDGGPPTLLSNEDVLNIINTQKTDIQSLIKQNEELQKIALQLQQQIIQNSANNNASTEEKEIKSLKEKIKELEQKLIETPTEIINIDMTKSKSEPEI